MEHLQRKSNSGAFGKEIPQEQNGENARSPKPNVLLSLGKSRHLADPTDQGAAGACIGRAWPERPVPVLTQEEEAFLTGISRCEIFSLQQTVAPQTVVPVRVGEVAPRASPQPLLAEATNGITLTF